MDRFQQLDRKVDQICSMDQGQAFDLKVSVVINCFFLSSLMVGHFFEHINPFFYFFLTRLLLEVPVAAEQTAQPCLMLRIYFAA